jgi:hypothetical protein
MHMFENVLDNKTCLNNFYIALNPGTAGVLFAIGIQGTYSST